MIYELIFTFQLPFHVESFLATFKICILLRNRANRANRIRIRVGGGGVVQRSQ